jgi:glycosyltransferase involved in cell wall biosynthesis
MNQPLHILMITHKHKLGTEARSFAMAKELVRSGHQVSIMLISRTRRFGITEYDTDGIHAIETPDLLWGRFRTGWDIWNTLNRIYFLNKDKTQYDLIHCFETRPITIYPALFLSRKEHIPLITDWNDWWGRHGLIEVNRPAWYRYTCLSFVETYYEEAFRARSSGLTVISTALKHRAVELGAEEKDISVIPGGAPGGYFPEHFLPKSKDECRRILNMPVNDPVLGFASADTHLDMEIVLASLVIVARKYPRVKLLITGMVKQSVKELIKKWKVEERIVFSGFTSVEDFPIYLGTSDLFLLPMADRPYNHGRWPNKMGDYLAIGRPTVANPVGDIKPLFEKYKVGLLAGWDAADFAEKITFLLDHPEISEQMGQTAREVAKNEYDWSILGKTLEAFYYKILDEQQRNIKNQNEVPNEKTDLNGGVI